MSIIGMDIGRNTCKLAVPEGDKIRLISKRMPENTLGEDKEVASHEILSRFLRDLKAEEKIHAKDCALVLATSQAFFRHVFLPPMTEDALLINLPYEFRDFMSGDPEGYVYDYAVDEIVYNEAGEPLRMELYAAAASKALVSEYADILKKAGMRLKVVLPAPMAYAALLRSFINSYPEKENEASVFVDIGHTDLIVSLFHGARYDSSRTTEFGCEEFDRTIADLKGIDPYTAGAYKFTNFEGVLDTPECLGLCDRFALEVTKVVNFYNFNNPDKEINNMYFIGGGAAIPQLTDAIAQAVSVPVSPITAILPSFALPADNASSCALAFAGMLEGEAAE